MSKAKAPVIAGVTLCLLPAILTLAAFSAACVMGDTIQIHDKHSWRADMVAYALFTMLLSFVMPFAARALGLMRTARVCTILACGILLFVVMQTCGGR